MFCISVDPRETATGTPLVYGPYTDEDIALSDWGKMGRPDFGVLPLRRPAASIPFTPTDEKPQSGGRLRFDVLLHAADEGGYWSEVILVPGAGSQGGTIEETVANTRRSLVAVLQTMNERGEMVPQLTDKDRWVTLRMGPI